MYIKLKYFGPPEIFEISSILWVPIVDKLKKVPNFSAALLKLSLHHGGKVDAWLLVTKIKENLFFDPIQSLKYLHLSHL